MKRMLSVILTICMLAAFVPATSAADTQPNFTINYDISGDLAAACGGSAMSAPLNTINLAYTNGFYELGTVGTVTNWASSSDNFKAYGSGANTNIAMRRWYWSGVKVWVPMAGTYTLKVNYATGLAFSQNNMRVYWNAAGNKTGKVGEYKSPEGNYATDEKWNQQFITLSPTPFTATVTAAAPGYYYVAFEVDGTGDNIINGLYARASFASISLESGDGNGNAIVLGKIDAPFELNTTDNKTKTLSASGYLSQTREAVTFKYESSDNSVATVDENGLVTAVGAGEATITATSADDGDNVTVPLTTKVTVTDPTAYTITYDIAGTMSKYGMAKNSSNVQLHMASVKYLNTNGFFEYVAAYPTVNGTSSQAEYQSTGTIAMKYATSYLTFKIRVPYEGDYKLKVNHDRATRGGYVDVYIGNAKGEDFERVGSYDCYGTVAGYMGDGRTTVEDTAKLVKEDGTLGNEATFHLTAGEHTIKFANRKNELYTNPVAERGSIGTFKLIKGGSSNVLPMHGFATIARSNGVPVETLFNGETVTANAAVYTTDAKAAATATTLTSSNPAVLEVIDATTVKTVGAGTATVYADIEYNGTTYRAESNQILVTDPTVNGATVSFYADATADVDLVIEGLDYTQGEVAGEIEVETNRLVKLTAPTDIEGKIFRGWMRGSEDNGVWISNQASISVKLLTNTFLTAVYDAVENEDTATVEFWNWSGQYLGSKSVEKGTAFGAVEKPDVHELTGYEAAGWSVADNAIVSGLTRAVAQFNKKADMYKVTVPDGVTGATTGDYEFDTKVTLYSETPVYWKRDGKTIDYGTTYSFYVWDDTVITTSTVGNEGPKVILDKHDDYGTYMIEFDVGEEDAILEAGILFGNNPNVTSFDSKAVSARMDLSHGQFTAVANTTEGGATNAVGYIIYLDGHIARVIYTK